MPDIQVTCSRCRKNFRVSEFVNREFINCPACGAEIRARVAAESEPAAPAGGQRGKLELRKLEEPGCFTVEKPVESASEPGEWKFTQQVDDLREGHVVPKQKMTHHIASWLLFVVLGSLMGLLRYTKVLDVDLEAVWPYTPYVYIAFWLIVTLKAFKDEVLQGILSLLVPFYWVYYLFLISDDFYIRALCAGLTVGIAEDSFFFYRDLTKGVYEAVSKWIASGGGEIR